MTKPKLIQMAAKDKHMLISAVHIEFFVLKAIRSKMIAKSNVHCAESLCAAKLQIQDLWRNINKELKSLQ